MNLAQLVQYVRDLTGVYSTDLLSDDLIKQWLDETYSEVNRAEDWPWLLGDASGTLAPGSTTITLTNGSSRVREFAIQYPNGVLYQVPSRFSSFQTIDGDDELFYDVSVSGVITLSKALNDPVTYRVSYIKAAPTLSDSLPQASAFPIEFEPLLAYRAAAKTLKFQADTSDRYDSYFMEYATMLEAMTTQLILDDDLGPIQIGGEILRIDGRAVGRVNVRFRSV